LKAPHFDRAALARSARLAARAAGHLAIRGSGAARLARYALAAGARRDKALLPASSISGRSLVFIIAIMAFLGSITAGTVQLVSSASTNWRSSIAREVTIQLRPQGGRDIEADVAAAAALARGTAGVAAVEVYSKEQSTRLLEPWLGQGLELAEIPIPRIIAVKVFGQPDFSALRQTLAETIPGASLDDHRVWTARLSTMANAMILVGMVILVLVLTASGLAVAFATRGAMAGTREIIDVLHLVGGTDRFIANQFQRHFLRLGLKGGGIGALAAIVVFLGAGLASRQWVATPGGDQIDALFGTFSLGLGGYGAVIVIAGVVALITTIVSRLTVFRNLSGLE
jgi:cell division transport system permease protein